MIIQLALCRSVIISSGSEGKSNNVVKSRKEYEFILALPICLPDKGPYNLIMAFSSEVIDKVEMVVHSSHNVKDWVSDKITSRSEKLGGSWITDPNSAIVGFIKVAL